MGLVLKLVGGKLGAAWLIAALAAGGWGWWQGQTADAERARADELVEQKALLAERLGYATRTANENAAKHQAALRESARREAELAAARRSEDAIRAEFQTRLSELQEATRDASPEYQACMRVPVPGGVLRALRVRDDAPGGAAPGGRDEDRDGAGDAAGGPAPAL